MSFLSHLATAIFGESETAVKTALIKTGEATLEAFVPTGVQIATDFLASKGFALGAAEVTDLVNQLIKPAEKAIEQAAGVTEASAAAPAA